MFTSDFKQQLLLLLIIRKERRRRIFHFNFFNTQNQNLHTLKLNF